MKNFEARIPLEGARSLENSVAELAVYMRKTEKEIIEAFADAFRNRQQEWETYSPLSVLDFHRNTEASIFLYMKWNAEAKYQKIYDTVYMICSRKKVRILDFGGGTGELSILLASSAMAVDYMDVPGKVFNFAQWRFRRRFLDIPVYTSLNQVKTYDTVICLDVLSYLEKPFAHLKKFNQILNPGGVLLLTKEQLNPAHPMVLEKNREFLENLDDYCAQAGFQSVINKENPDLLFYMKAAQ